MMLPAMAENASFNPRQRGSGQPSSSLQCNIVFRRSPDLRRSAASWLMVRMSVIGRANGYPQTFLSRREQFTPMMAGPLWETGWAPTFDLSRKRVSSYAGLAWRQIKNGVTILNRAASPTTSRLAQNIRTRTRVGLDMAIGLGPAAVPAFAKSEISRLAWHYRAAALQ